MIKRLSYAAIVPFACFVASGCAAHRDASLRLFVEALESSKEIALNACEEITKATLECEEIKHPECKKLEEDTSCTTAEQLRNRCKDQVKAKVDLCKMRVGAHFSSVEEPVKSAKDVDEAFRLACSFIPMFPKEVRGLAERICQ